MKEHKMHLENVENRLLQRKIINHLKGMDNRLTSSGSCFSVQTRLITEIQEDYSEDFEVCFDFFFLQWCEFRF